MDRNDVLRLLSTPANVPAYTAGPYRFTNREYLRITHRTEPTALRRVVPESLQLREPLVRFEAMRMPDVTALGDYTESGQMVTVEHNGEAGEIRPRHVRRQPPSDRQRARTFGVPEETWQAASMRRL
jgi:acetoacetate decarboxylase